MFIKEIKDTFTVYKIKNISIAKLIKKCPLIKDKNPLVPKHPTHVGSFILIDCDNAPFLLLFEDGLNEVGRGASNRRIEHLNIEADKIYEAAFPAYVLKKDDVRHTSDYLLGRQKYYEEQGMAFGCRHNGILAAQGQCFNKLSINGLLGQERLNIKNEAAGAKLNKIFPAYLNREDKRHPFDQYCQGQEGYYELRKLASE